MFKDIGWPELLLVLAVVLIIFGAGKLPSIARDFGKSIREFRQASKGETTDTEKDEQKKAEVKPAETADPQAKAEDKRFINLN